MDRVALYLFTFLFSICLIHCSNCNETECSNTEKMRKNCLNGGQCIILHLESREPVCQCLRRFTGGRCQDLNFSLLFGESTLPVNKTWMYVIIIGCVVGGFILGILAAFCITKLCKRRRRQRRAEKENQNGRVPVYTEVPVNTTEMGAYSV